MTKKYQTVTECLDALEKTKNKPADQDPDRKDAFEDLYELMGISKVQCPGSQLIAR